MRKGILAAAALLVTGCALLLGKPYQPLRSVPDGMGVIYIYDAGAGLGSRVFIDPDLSSPSAKHYLVLATDGYYPYLTPEGPVRVFDDTEGNPFGCVEIQVRKDQPHWVSVAEQGDVLEVKRVPEADATAALGGHKRLSREALANSSGVATPRDCEQGAEVEVAPTPAPEETPDPPAEPNGEEEPDDEVEEKPTEDKGSGIELL